MTPPINMPPSTIRRARPADIASLRAMQERSMWMLGSSYYSDEEVAGFVTQYGTMDDAVVAEGHFFVAQNHAGKILGSGGWTRRPRQYTGGLGEADETEVLPSVRSVFVDPAVVRRGIATAIMAHVESDALDHGVRDIALTATFLGAAFYKRLGYRAQRRERLPLNDGGGFGCIKMAKRLQRPVDLFDDAKAWAPAA